MMPVSFRTALLAGIVVGCSVLWPSPSEAAEQLTTGDTARHQPQPFWVHYRAELALAAVILLGQAVLIATLLIMRDRRHRRMLDAELQRAELAHAARLATAGELGASIAHEISQPLFAILVNAEAGERLLAAEQPPLEEIRQLLGEIRRDNVRATEVIRKLRELLGKHSIEMQSLDVNDVVTGVLSFIAVTIRHRSVSILSELSARLPAIYGDRVQLGQVLMNLFMNAIDAVAEMPPERRRITVSTVSTDEGSVEVAVSDNGPGIAQEHLGQLFDPFFSTKREGMGLGLSIAQSIVQAHDGCLTAESSATGATFRFTIPAATPARAALCIPKPCDLALSPPRHPHHV
jgi:C4-dicarboxylate-specific signal transduction histidine kinase